MKIVIYTESNDSITFTTKEIPSDVKNISLFIPKTPDSIGGLGQIQYEFDKPDENILCRRMSDNIYFNAVTYLLVDDKDKFTIKDTNDVIKFYQYFSGQDITKFKKEFKCLEKKNELDKDF